MLAATMEYVVGGSQDARAAAGTCSLDMLRARCGDPRLLVVGSQRQDDLVFDIYTFGGCKSKSKRPTSRGDPPTGSGTAPCHRHPALFPFGYI